MEPEFLDATNFEKSLSEQKHSCKRVTNVKIGTRSYAIVDEGRAGNVGPMLASFKKLRDNTYLSKEMICPIGYKVQKNPYMSH